MSETWKQVEANGTAAPNGETPGNGRSMPSLWGWHTYLSLIISAGILVFMASLVDWKEVWEHVVACKKGYLLLGMLAHYATYPVRGLRWQRSLSHLPLQGKTRKFALVVFFYNFIDNLVPGKLGDLYGAHLARINFGIRRSAALGSIVFLRMVDAWLVLVLAVASSWVLFSSHLPKGVVWGLVGGLILALVVTGILLPFVLTRKAIPRWVPEKAQEMVRSFQSGMLPARKELGSISLLTLGIWVLETLWMYLLTAAFGLDLGLAEVVFLTQLPLLASAFPLTPSGVGVVEATLYTSLGFLSVPQHIAVSVTLLNRLVDYWLHIGLGVLAWGMREKLGLRTWREVPPEAAQVPQQQHEITA